MNSLRLIVFLAHSTVTLFGWMGYVNTSENVIWCTEDITMTDAYSTDLTRIKFHDGSACIMLSDDRMNKYSISYLIGPNATINVASRGSSVVRKEPYSQGHKRETIKRVVEYWMTQKDRDRYEISIRKEIYGHETEWFFNSYKFLEVLVDNGSRTHTPIRRMYRLTNTTERARFIQVLPNFSELNRENYFILETGSEVFMYHPQKRGSDNTNNKYYKAASDFGNLILRFSKKNYYASLKHISVAQPSSSNDRFFELLNGASEEKTWNNIPENSNTKDTVENNSLYEYPNLLNEKHDGYFKLNIVNFFGCYVLEKNSVNEAVLYIGARASPHHISHILNYGEYLASRGITVSVAGKSNPLMHFVTAFEELNNVVMNKFEFDDDKQQSLTNLLP